MLISITEQWYRNQEHNFKKLIYIRVTKMNLTHQTPNHDLLMLVEKVKIILISKATGKNADETEYENCRKQLLNNDDLKIWIPNILTLCSNLGEFWLYIKPKFSRYRLRTEHIIEEFNPLINFIEKCMNPLQVNTKDT